MATPSDTISEAFARQLEGLRAMGPQARLHLALQMSEELREVAKAGIRARHPGFTDRQVREELEVLLLGRDLGTVVRRARLAPTR
jgi:hypothetical protein